MNDIALEWKSVNYIVRDGFFLQKKTILENINLTIEKGSVTSLVGPNGAGKTTVIKLGSGLISADSGEILLDGKPVSHVCNRKRLGLVTENQYAYPFLKLKEWLKLLSGLSGLVGTDLENAVGQSLESVELTDFAHQYMRNLSKGQAQRAGIAQAVAHSPDVLLLDEPMSGLDPYWRHRINQMIGDFKNDGGTVLFSSHILSDVETLSDKVAILQKGKLQWCGSLRELDLKTKGYEVTCDIQDVAVLKSQLAVSSLSSLPDGGWLFQIGVEGRNKLIQIASTGLISLKSMVPIQDEMGDILFRL